MTQSRAPNSLSLLLLGGLNVSWAGLRFCALLASLMIYGVWGSPTPETLGWAEIFTGLFLVFAIGAEGALRVAPHFDAPDLHGRPSWLAPARLLLFYGLSIPLVVAVMRGTDLVPIIRDIIPFLFLFLPLFLGLVAGCYSRHLFVAFGFLGVVFAMRSLSPFSGLPAFAFLQGDDLFYLANSPAVLFAAIGASGLAMQRFDLFSLRGWGMALGLIALSALPLAAMGMNLQRASISLYVLSMLCISGLSFVRRPLCMLIFLAVFALLCAAFWPAVAALFAMLAGKTQDVGGNMRLQELAAVWEALSAHPLHVLFGLGWGAHFQSPAVGMLSVNFTHSLVSAILLKCGLIGVCCLLLYVMEMFRILVWAFIRHKNAMPLVLALLCPLFIDVFFYAAYKSYEFGLLLLLVATLPRALKNKGVDKHVDG